MKNDTIIIVCQRSGRGKGCHVIETGDLFATTQSALSPEDWARVRRKKALHVAAFIKGHDAYVCSETFACSTCGCLVKLRVTGGLRCLVCWPPRDLPDSVRAVLPSLCNASLVDDGPDNKEKGNSHG